MTSQTWKQKKKKEEKNFKKWQHPAYTDAFQMSV